MEPDPEHGTREWSGFRPLTGMVQKLLCSRDLKSRFRPLTGMVPMHREEIELYGGFRPLTGMVQRACPTYVRFLLFSPPYGDGTFI